MKTQKLISSSCKNCENCSLNNSASKTDNWCSAHLKTVLHTDTCKMFNPIAQLIPSFVYLTSITEYLSLWTEFWNGVFLTGNGGFSSHEFNNENSSEIINAYLNYIAITDADDNLDDDLTEQQIITWFFAKYDSVTYPAVVYLNQEVWFTRGNGTHKTFQLAVMPIADMVKY